MATATVTLAQGLTIGETVHREAEIREATAGDVLDAMAEAERVVIVEGNPELLQSPARMALALLRRRVVRIGTFEGPFTPEIIKRLSAADLEALQHESARLDTASLKEALSTAGKTPSAPAE
jgi:phage FluMu protein gp41